MMKKLMSFATALLTLTAASAQQVDDELQLKSFKAAPAFSENMEFVQHLSRSASVDDIILEPQGDLIIYAMRGVGVRSIYGGLTEATMQGPADIVWGENGKVYIHQPLGAFEYGYAEGELSEDGKQIIVQLPQPVAALRAWDNAIGDYQYYPLMLSVMDKVSDAEEDATNGPEYQRPGDEENVLVYTIAEDGTISQTTPYQEAFETDEETYLKYPEVMLSCYVYAPYNMIYGGEDTDMIEYWYGYLNINQNFKPLPTDLIVNEIPDDLEWNSNWAITSTTSWNTLVDGAIQDGHIYLKNLSPHIPDAVVVGDIEDGKVVFKDKQYMGICTTMYGFITFRGAYSYVGGVNEYTGEDEILYALTNQDVVMEYDEATQTLTLNDGTKGFIMNSILYDDYVFYYCAFDSPKIHLQTTEDLAAAPLTPEILAWTDYSEWYPYAYYGTTFQFPELNENNAVINYDDLYYRVFFNDEPYIFSPDDYGIEDDMEWISTTFIDANWKIMGYGDLVMVYFSVEGINKVGLQSAYIAEDGSMYTSEIVSLQVGTDGIVSVNDEINNTTEPRWFNLQGMPVANPKAPGIYIDANTGRKVIK